MSDLISIRPHHMLVACVAAVFNKGLQNAPAVAEILRTFPSSRRPALGHVRLQHL